MGIKFRIPKTGEKIKEKRKEHNFTQTELGNMLNPPVSQSQIGKWESQLGKNYDKCSIDLYHLLQLSKILEVNLFEFYFDGEIIGYIINNSSMSAQFREFIIEDEVNEELNRVLKDKLVTIYNDEFLIIKRKKLDDSTMDAILGKISRFEIGEGYSSNAYCYQRDFQKD